MKKEDKELLLRDLCARLPYGVKATTTSNGWRDVYDVYGYADDRIYLDCIVYDEGDEEWLVESVKPYLRPMSSMTEEEYKEYIKTQNKIAIQWDEYGMPIGSTYVDTFRTFDWLNAYHFDYRGLIEKGLALEAPKDMYNE